MQRIISQKTARPAAQTPRPVTETARPAAETARPSLTVYAKDLPPAERVTAPNTGNAKQDQKYQQQQKLQVQQVKERQTLQTKQEQDHQRFPQSRRMNRNSNRWSSRTNNRLRQRLRPNQQRKKSRLPSPTEPCGRTCFSALALAVGQPLSAPTIGVPTLAL